MQFLMHGPTDINLRDKHCILVSTHFLELGLKVAETIGDGIIGLRHLRLTCFLAFIRLDGLSA
jgi:hypothetical protein